MSQQIEDLISQGRYFEARTKAVALLVDSESLRVQQLYALAMSKCGVPEAAMHFLEPIYMKSQDDPETAGILGGIYKELFIKTKEPRYAVLSRDTYLKNFTFTKSYYTGINAATMSAIAGQSSQGKQIALEVISLLEGSHDSFWEVATLAEAFLISKNREKAKELYTLARGMVTSDWGKINSIYNQLWLLNHYVAIPNELLKIFKPPTVAAFVGHMIDHPRRMQSRFPASIEAKVKESLASSIASVNAKIGYCSLACGGDILFAEAMEEAGGEVNLFLPCDKNDFLEESVRFAGEHWVERCERLIKRFPVTFITEENYKGYDDLFFLQSGVIFGAAIMRSDSSHTKPYLITLLSAMDLKRKQGGTRDTLKMWPYPTTILNVNPDSFNNSSPVNPVAVSLEPLTEQVREINRPVAYLFMADFPDTSSDQKELLLKSLLAKVEGQSPLPIGLIWNGDVLLVAYSTIEGTTELTKILSGLLSRFNKKGNLKISLHVGPVTIDPVESGIGKKIEGTAVAIVRQLHTYASADEVYASAPYAMELALSIQNYSIDFAGKFILPETHQEQEIFKIGSV